MDNSGIFIIQKLKEKNNYTKDHNNQTIRFTEMLKQ